MLLKDGEGRYIWQQNQQLGKPSILLGHEVRQAADMNPVGAAALPVAFGNFKMGYTIVDRVGDLDLARSVLGQALRAVLHPQAGRRRRHQLRGHQAAADLSVPTLGPRIDLNIILACA